MKTALKILCFLLITAGTTSAQPFSIGFIGGPASVSAFRTSIQNNTVSPTLGYSLSLGLQFKLNKYFYLRIEPGIERKGFNISNTSMPDSISIPKDEKGVLDYYSAPVMLRFQAGKKIKFMLDLGTYASYLNKAQTTYGTPGTSSNTVDATKNFKQLDLGVIAAVGLGYTVAKRVIVSVHYKRSYGLIDVSKDASQNYESLKTTASNYLVGIAYGFK